MKEKEKMYRHFSGVVFDDSGSKLSLYDKNMTLVEAVIDIFGFTENSDLTEIKRKVSREHVAELHKLMAWLWPPDTDVSKFLPQPTTNLRALYMGNMRPETILRSVGRYSLYCDEVLVMNPFMNPWFIAPEYNPIMHPEDYVGETWKWVLFTLQLAPWIQDRQVLFLPNPVDYDSQLRTEFWESAEKRLEPQQDQLMEMIEKEWPLDEIGEADFKRSWMSMPEHAMREKIKEYDPSQSEEFVDSMIEYIEKMKDADPYFVTNPTEKGAYGIKTYQAGGNLEQGLYVSQLTGAHLYTDISFRWKEIMTAKNVSSGEDPWSPISYGFQNLDFKFLDQIDLQFVLNMKSEGRLSNFRDFMRKTWNEISSKEEITFEKAHGLALEFQDELKEKYGEAESEWDKIDKDLRNWLLGRTGLGSLIATGGIDWIVPALGFSLEGVNRLLNARHDRKEFRKNVPLSVFVDLKNGKKK